MNTGLRDAMEAARVKPGQLARRLGMEPKTINRWLADEGRIPHPGTRELVARELGVNESVLWPNAVKSLVKGGGDREIVAAYPYRNAAPTALWDRLFNEATHRCTYAGYTNYFIWQQNPRFSERLTEKAARGCEIRFLVGDPESETTRRREEVEGVPLTVGTRIKITLDALSKIPDRSGIEARFSDEHLAMSVFIFDGQMLVTPHLSNLLGHDSPLLHIRRMGPDGLYDRFAGHVDALWSAGRPIPDLE